MMMAWKVSGLSQSPAIIVSRPASMRLAMAISPSRDSSSTEPISRRYMRTGSSVRSVGSFLAGRRRRPCRSARQARWRLPRRRRQDRLGSASSPDFLVLDDVDAHVGEHGHGVLDLLGGHFLRRQHRVQFVHGDVAALLGGLDHLLDGIIGKVEQRSIGTAFAFGLGLFLFWFRHAFHVSKRPDANPGWGLVGGAASLPSPAPCERRTRRAAWFPSNPAAAGRFPIRPRNSAPSR